MGKAPAFQFYVKDWLCDPELRKASASTRGIWIDLLCFMWQSNCKGILELTNEQIAKLTGTNNGEVELFLKEANEYRFCDISVTRNGLSQICNRRMSREEKRKESNRLRQKKHRDNKARNAKVTPLSPSPSSPSTPKRGKKAPLKPWPKDFKMDEKMRAFAIKNNIDPAKLDDFFADFKDWADANQKVYADWKAAFRTRVRKAPELSRQFLKQSNTQQSKFDTPYVHPKSDEEKFEEWKKNNQRK